MRLQPLGHLSGVNRMEGTASKEACYSAAPDCDSRRSVLFNSMGEVAELQLESLKARKEDRESEFQTVALPEACNRRGRNL